MRTLCSMRRHIGLAPTQTSFRIHPLLLIIGLGVLLLLCALFSRTFFVIALVIGILAINTVLEMHKLFTQGIPVDFEILTVGVAYLAATGSIGFALLVALIGPVVAEVARGSFTNAAFFRPIVLVIVAFTAVSFGPSALGILSVVCIGLALHYIRVMFTARFHWFYSILPRLTQLVLALYVIFGILPILH
jgi:hypothetical protein